jgi:hypothetical protein
MFFKEVLEERLRRELEREFRTGEKMGRYPDTGAKSEWFEDFFGNLLILYLLMKVSDSS